MALLRGAIVAILSFSLFYAVSGKITAQVSLKEARVLDNMVRNVFILGTVAFVRRIYLPPVKPEIFLEGKDYQLAENMPENERAREDFKCEHVYAGKRSMRLEEVISLKLNPRSQERNGFLSKSSFGLTENAVHYSIASYSSAAWVYIPVSFNIVSVKDAIRCFRRKLMDHHEGQKNNKVYFTVIRYIGMTKYDKVPTERYMSILVDTSTKYMVHRNSWVNYNARVNKEINDLKSSIERKITGPNARVERDESAVDIRTDEIQAIMEEADKKRYRKGKEKTAWTHADYAVANDGADHFEDAILTGIRMIIDHAYAMAKLEGFEQILCENVSRPLDLTDVEKNVQNWFLANAQCTAIKVY